MTVKGIHSFLYVTGFECSQHSNYKLYNFVLRFEKNKINCKIAFHLKYTKLAYWIFFKMYIENYYFSHLSRMEHIEMLLLLKAHIDIQDLSIITVDKFLR